MLSTNFAFLRIVKRAEQQDESILQKTFVEFGSILTVVTSVDHQVIFGRRGTGKTHLLTKLKQDRSAENLVTVQVDMRNLGSPGGVYADTSLPISERGTRLLIDLLAAIHGKLIEQALDEIKTDNLLMGALEQFFDAHSTVTVVGETTIESTTSAESAHNAEAKLGVTASALPSMSVNLGVSASEKDLVSSKKTVKGKEVLRVNFGKVASALQKVVGQLPKRNLWILIDEWSEVPLDLQPFVAEILKRAVMQVSGVTVKIAAIEHRSKFLSVDSVGGRVGLEIGADAASALNLDEYMVFENDRTASISFFRKLVYAHVKSALEAENKKIEEKIKEEEEQRKISGTTGNIVASLISKHVIPRNEDELLSMGFSQGAVFDEVVRACEGVPRDAINILGQAAQVANEKEIVMDGVRQAARKWYQSSKNSAVKAHPQAKALLQWIYDEVIKKRLAKAFLLKDGTKDDLMDFLYDLRVIHLLRNGISSKDSPGDRFNVYAIDYGCYVDLVNTATMPRGLLDVGYDKSSDFVQDVPQTDFRSIRRCILDLGDFYSQNAPGNSLP